MTADAIVNGVHGYMPDNYVVPKEPQVREKLEWLKDQKLALMMHFGMYSQMGVYEFCLFDTKYTDFRVTNPGCPFSKNPCADIVKSVFDAFRAEGLGIAAYFSKPDWHSEDFWEDHGIGRKVSRMPTYDVKANPEKWAPFREFTKNQIVELVRDYGPVDVIWLDGGQRRRNPATGDLPHKSLRRRLRPDAPLIGEIARLRASSPIRRTRTTTSAISRLRAA